MAVTVTLGLQIKLDRLDEFKNVLREILPDTRAFSGCQDIRVIENQDSPGSITILEGWDSRRMGPQRKPYQAYDVADRDWYDGGLGRFRRG